MTVKDILAITSALILSVGGSGAIICALSNFIAERIAKRIDNKYQQKLEIEFEKYKSGMEHRKYVSKTQFDNEFQIYKQLSKAFFAVAVKASSFAHRNDGNRIIVIREGDIFSVEELKKIIVVNSDAQNLLFENAPFIPEEIYNEYFCLNEKANHFFWGIMGRVKAFSKDELDANDIITEDEIEMSEILQRDLNEVNKKVRKYLESLSIISE